MEIMLAESLGFCMGVKRAVDMAYKALDKAEGTPVTSLGPLIHNSQEMARLTNDGVGLAQTTADVPTTGTVVIRAHGVTPQAYDELKARGLRVMDGTCPYVHYSQRKARELYEEGYTVVITGERQHPEIVGILGHINDDAYAVKSVEEAAALPALERIGVIAQTTISPKKFQAIIDVLKTKAPEVKVCETICDATEENQKAIRELSGEVELLYVIGGRHSANSNKLVEVAREKCPHTFLIETPEEIDGADVFGVQRVGISAGASTPDWMIQRVVQHLRALDRTVNKMAA
jgi:(E)-4-hydroxy-3-methyl-but-2-enyl pyrophosphate reductase